MLGQQDKFKQENKAEATLTLYIKIKPSGLETLGEEFNLKTLRRQE